MSAEQERIDTVLDAAGTQFLCYGFKRVTMGDIAAEASISRPALYLLFKNKEEIFSAVLQRFMAAALEEIRTGIVRYDDLRDQLSFALDVWVARPYDMLREAPNAEELTDCTHGFARDIVESSFLEFESIIEEILTPHRTNLRKQRLSPRSVASLIGSAGAGIKAGASDGAVLRQRLDDLITLVVEAINTSNENHHSRRRTTA